MIARHRIDAGDLFEFFAVKPDVWLAVGKIVLLVTLSVRRDVRFEKKTLPRSKLNLIPANLRIANVLSAAY
jgi:hypothetical protein